MRSLAVLMLLAVSAAQADMIKYSFHNNCTQPVNAVFNDDINTLMVINPGGWAEQNRNTVGDDAPVLVSNGVGGLTKAGFYRVPIPIPWISMDLFIDISAGFDTGIRILWPYGSGTTLACRDAACFGNQPRQTVHIQALPPVTWLSPMGITFCG